MTPEIRKIVTYQEDVLIEGFKPAATPWCMFAAAAVITNPWAGQHVAVSYTHLTLPTKA